MKAFMFILAAGILTASCSSAGNKQEKRENRKDTPQVSSINLTLIQFHVTGMTCEGCENAIVTSINKLDGIREASASHTAEEVKVVYDSTLTSLRSLSKAIEDAGYTVVGPAGDG